jgi:hypothetical protein
MAMRSTNTAVLERIVTVDKAFLTEPYELPWAREARFFVQVLSITDAGQLSFTTEISPDGLHWTTLDEQVHTAVGPGLVTWLATGFGQWLRVQVVPNEGTTAVMRIYLVGKS